MTVVSRRLRALACFLVRFPVPSRTLQGSRPGPGRPVVGFTAVAAAAVVLAGCGGMPTTGSMRGINGPIVYTKVGEGEPTVVLQSGLGDGREPWAAVMQQLRERHSVFAYDRPGYGDSTGFTPVPRNPCGIATELHELLKSAGVKPPYLLVGHSIGGLYQYAYARQYPDEVAGIVLVDATHPLHLRRMQVEVPVMASMLENMSKRVFSGMMQTEFNMQTECVDALLQKPRPDVPVRVLTRTVYSPVEQASGFEAMVHALEPNWLPLVGGREIEPVTGAGHYIQRDKPGRVVQAVDAVADEIKIRAAARVAAASAASGAASTPAAAVAPTRTTGVAPATPTATGSVSAAAAASAASAPTR
ncbi:alpha/beta fold hydrolase [Roseateles amylovorans]|uniref:Alpha/beta hydrolase n=1 Tax=Roseateles amylovorans TaxID=2978473 RepID=A0ABY6AXU0_9BURK|nr:alpha/beta hydrolase [Roseateles amylovorans]UXH77723.1 alpha/beta hydrolase [Roseateles amylovorans]